MPSILCFSLFLRVFGLSIVFLRHFKGSSHVIVLIFGMILRDFEDLESIFGSIWIGTRCNYRCERNIFKVRLMAKAKREEMWPSELKQGTFPLKIAALHLGG